MDVYVQPGISPPDALFPKPPLFFFGLLPGLPIVSYTQTPEKPRERKSTSKVEDRKKGKEIDWPLQFGN